MNTLEILLNGENTILPEKEFAIKRLSEAYKQPVVFRLRALPYNRVSEITKMQADDMNVHIVLAGTLEPNLKDGNLLEKYNAPTPAEMIKKLLLPGEIEDLSREIEKLSGYRKITVEEIKKK